MSTVAQIPTPPSSVIEVWDEDMVYGTSEKFYVLGNLRKDFWKTKEMPTRGGIYRFRPKQLFIKPTKENLELWSKSEELKNFYDRKEDKLVYQYEPDTGQWPTYVLRENETKLLYAVERVKVRKDGRLEVLLPKILETWDDPNEVLIGKRKIWRYRYKIPVNVEEYVKTLRSEMKRSNELNRPKPFFEIGLIQQRGKKLNEPKKSNQRQ